MKAVCEIVECDRSVRCKGMCGLHYGRSLRTGSADLAPKLSMEERFWSKVREDRTGCWLWTAAQTTAGYGKFGVNRRATEAHRVAYELMIGPIPEGTELDHLCCTLLCVNPYHLDPVTHEVNVQRANVMTHCHKGHELTPENLMLWRRKSRPSTWTCRTCARERQRRADAKRRNPQPAAVV